MPIYEYQCDDCGQRSEAIQKMSDPPLTICEQCGGKLRKLISAPAFQFKGSGWYVTDYANKSGGDSKKSGDGGKESKSDSGSGSSESSTSSSKNESSSGSKASSADS